MLIGFYIFNISIKHWDILLRIIFKINLRVFRKDVENFFSYSSTARLINFTHQIYLRITKFHNKIKSAVSVTVITAIL